MRIDHEQAISGIKLHNLLDAGQVNELEKLLRADSVSDSDLHKAQNLMLEAADKGWDIVSEAPSLGSEQRELKDFLESLNAMRKQHLIANGVPALVTGIKRYLLLSTVKASELERLATTPNLDAAGQKALTGLLAEAESTGWQTPNMQALVVRNHPIALLVSSVHALQDGLRQDPRAMHERTQALAHQAHVDGTKLAVGFTGGSWAAIAVAMVLAPFGM